MHQCDFCGLSFKTAQGLAGHRRLRHGAYKPGDEIGRAFGGRQLHRKVMTRLGEKLADRLADAILMNHGQEILGAYLEELLSEGRDPRAAAPRGGPKQNVAK